MRVPVAILLLQGVVLASVGIAQVPPAATPSAARPDVIFVATPPRVVDLILQMAKVRKDDIVYDLGCGDGRLVILAAKNFGARGVGIDIDPKLIAEAKNLAAVAKVSDKVEFREADLFKSDFRDATVITLYLQDHLNVRLRPLIFAQVKPGTRVVSHMFRMGDWQPVAERSVTMEGTDYEVFLWIVPANISGRWRLNSRPTEPAVPHTFIIEQEFQRFTLRRDDRAEIIGEGTMSGNDFTLSLAVADETKRLTFTGSLDGDSLTLSTPGKRLSWKAKRAPGTETPVEKPARK